MRDIFLPKWFFFSSLSPCWFFICGGEWRKPPRKVSYKRTFGAPDQGQMLDVWESQTAESALMAIIHVLNHHRSHGLKIHVLIFKRSPVGISALIGSVRAGISDWSGSTDILYINSGTECWIFPRHQHWHLDTTPPNIWDCVESYAIHMILSCRLKITFTSNLKVIIYFLEYSY